MISRGRISDVEKSAEHSLNQAKEIPFHSGDVLMVERELRIKRDNSTL